MAYNVNTLPDYVSDKNKEIMTEVLFGPTSVALLNVQLGIKYQEKINMLVTDPVLQERVCGWNPQGDATFTEAILEVAPYMVEMEFCPEDVRKKFLNEELKTAAGFEVLPAEKSIVKDIVKRLKNTIDNKIWMADTNNSDLFDGLVKRIIAEGTNSYNASDKSLYDRVRSTYLAIDSAILDEAEIYMGVDMYKELCQEMVTKNLYHYSADVNTNDMSLVFPGTDTKVRAIAGLNNSNTIIAGNPEWMLIGMDGANDEEIFDLFYDKAAQNFKLVVKFNLGTQIVFGTEFVYNNGQA